MCRQLSFLLLILFVLSSLLLLYSLTIGWFYMVVDSGHHIYIYEYILIIRLISLAHLLKDSHSKSIIDHADRSPVVFNGWPTYGTLSPWRCCIIELRQRKRCLSPPTRTASISRSIQTQHRLGLQTSSYLSSTWETGRRQRHDRPRGYELNSNWSREMAPSALVSLWRPSLMGPSCGAGK